MSRKLRSLRSLSTLQLPLFEVTINRDSDSRVDKYRANAFSPTTLYHATLKDDGDRTIPAVAKVSTCKDGTFLFILSRGLSTMSGFVHLSISSLVCPYVSPFIDLSHLS